jgi:hypothetical protein
MLTPINFSAPVMLIANKAMPIRRLTVDAP